MPNEYLGGSAASRIWQRMQNDFASLLTKIESKADKSVVDSTAKDLEYLTYGDIRSARDEMGITDFWKVDDISIDYPGGTWFYRRFAVENEVLKVGDTITIVISEGAFNPNLNGIRLMNGALNDYQSDIRFGVGVHTLRLNKDGLGIHFQISDGTAATPGTYYAKGIKFYKGDFSTYHPQTTANNAVSYAQSAIQEVSMARETADRAVALNGVIAKEQSVSMEAQYTGRGLLDNGWVNNAGDSPGWSTSKAIAIPDLFDTLSFDRDIAVQGGGTNARACDVCFFSSDASFGGTYLIGSIKEIVRNKVYDVPNGAKFLRVSYLSDDSPALTFYSELDIMGELGKKVSRLDTTERFMRKTGNLSAGGRLELGENDIKIGKHIAFQGDVTAMDTIRICNGYHSYGAAFVEVSATGIKVVNYASSESVIAEWSHGLTISNNISVFIDVPNSITQTAKIRVTSNGASYENSIAGFWGGNGKVYAESVGSTLTNCVLSFSADGYNEDIHLYGDSYFGVNSTSRWIHYLVEDGFTRALIDGYAGKASSRALVTFKENIAHSTPKIAVWCVGMNNPDTSSAVNSTWKSDTDQFITLCEENGIVPVLATVPTARGGAVDDADISSMRINKYKNAYVRNSGYRYIDFDKAVGASEENGSWFDGMLASDGVHPTEAGAKALYSRFLVDFPEIMKR